MGRREEGLELAQSARALAISADAEQVAANAGGNVGYFLMQLERYRKALEVFEEILEEQRRIGDTQGIKNTEHNIRACLQRVPRNLRKSDHPRLIATRQPAHRPARPTIS